MNPIVPTRRADDASRSPDNVARTTAPLAFLSVAVVGDFTEGRLAEYLARGFEGNGLQAHRIDDARMTPKSRVSRLIRNGMPVIRDDCRMADEILQAEPTAVVVVKSPYLPVEVVARLRRNLRGRTINWLPDDPFVRLPPAVPKTILKHYDLVVTYSSAIGQRLARRERIPAVTIPFGFDPDDYNPDGGTSAEVDCSFVGQFSRHRAGVMEALLDAGLSLRIWGSGWNKANERVRSAWDAHPAFGASAAACYKRGSVALNLLHPRNNLQSHNMRTFEAPATGRPAVMTYTLQQEALLAQVGGIRFYRGIRDIAGVVNGVLSLAESPEPNFQALLRNHTYRDRCRRLLEAVL